MEPAGLWTDNGDQKSSPATMSLSPPPIDLPAIETSFACSKCGHSMRRGFSASPPLPGSVEAGPTLTASDRHATTSPTIHAPALVRSAGRTAGFGGSEVPKHHKRRSTMRDAAVELVRAMSAVEYALPGNATFREKVFFYLVDTRSTTGRIIDIILLLFNLLAVIMFIVATEREGFESVDEVEVPLTVLFTVEYVVRWWAHPNRLRYPFTMWAVADLLSVLPFYLELMFPGSSVRGLRSVRSIRVLRVFRFLRFLQTTDFFFGDVSVVQLQVLRLAFTMFTTVLTSAGFLYALEGPDAVVESKFHDLGDCVYFAVSMMSTVGFGDLVPVTTEGRWVCTFFILASIVLTPWQAGRLVQLMMVDTSMKQVTCRLCGLTGHDPDASHCKACGNLIFQVLQNNGVDLS